MGELERTGNQDDHAGHDRNGARNYYMMFASLHFTWSRHLHRDTNEDLPVIGDQQWSLFLRTSSSCSLPSSFLMT
jgi:hypothetical protein